MQKGKKHTTKTVLSIIHKIIEAIGGCLLVLFAVAFPIHMVVWSSYLVLNAQGQECIRAIYAWLLGIMAGCLVFVRFFDLFLYNANDRTKKENIKSTPQKKRYIDAATCPHDYDPHGCCRRCGHLKPGGIAYQEFQKDHQTRETMDRLMEMIRAAEDEFTCNEKAGDVCPCSGSCDLHRQREVARYLAVHGVAVTETEE